MQIDFHHAVTYVTARLAGFPKKDAEKIAYAAQYVDDATSPGTVVFNNKAAYHRMCSAHKMVDVRNINLVENQHVWMPFHFLPGNGGMAAGENPDGSFIEKIVSRPGNDNPVARDMVEEAIREQGRPYGLHRFGITMHVFADTWAHQQFAGVEHPINEVEKARETGTKVFSNGLQGWLRDVLDDAIPPLGHGRANIFPDMPFLTWTYRNGLGKDITRRNTDDFCEAAEQMCRAMQRYQGSEEVGLPAGDAEKVKDLFSSLQEKKGENRHKQWLAAIADGTFSFGPETVEYSGKDGEDSWKKLALGTGIDKPVYPYKKSFLKSDWKLFHDAVQAHHLYINHQLLPKYGICAT